MSLLKIFSGKTNEERLLKRAEMMLNRGRPGDAEKILSRLANKYANPPASDEEKLEHAHYYTLLGKASLLQKEQASIKYCLTANSYRANEPLLRECISLIESQELLTPEATELVLTLSEQTSGERGFLLNYAKRLVANKRTNLTPSEHEVVLSATKAFTLWKGGSELLAEEFLKAGRKDAEAISIYRIAYPHRKDDEKLVEILLQRLVETEERTDFSAQVYQDYLASGKENDDALRLLVEYYIDKNVVTPQNIALIESAIQKRIIDKEHMELLSLYVLRTRKEFLDKKTLLLNIYRAGYYNKNVLAFLAIAFAEEGNFSEEALQAYEDALKNNLLTKRITLLIAEHFLNEGRNDEFACRVYEHYLSSWPERRQPRIYLLLAKNYMQKKRTDEQAQRIYEDALANFPEFTEVLPYLAASYLTYETRQPKAFTIYERAYPILEDEYIKRQIALILAEQRIENSNFDRKTLEYIENALPIASERRRANLIDARNKCYLALERKDPQALSIYLELYMNNPQESAENLRLVSILSDALLETPDALEIDPELRMEILYRRFELEKFNSPANVSLYLLQESLLNRADYKYILHLAVRCFEIDPEKTANLLHSAGRSDLLKKVGTFFLERYNYSLASQAFSIRNHYEPSEENTYQLAKILLYEGKTKEALEMLTSIRAEVLEPSVLYWKAAALQQENKPKEAAKLLAKLKEKSDSIPQFLLLLREGINAELVGDYPTAIEAYQKALSDERAKPIHRWLEIEIGLAYFRNGELEKAKAFLERIYRANPNGRAEQRNYSYVLFHYAYQLMLNNDWEKALSTVLECVELNRSDRLLRSVAVELLLNFANRFFFNGEYNTVTKILETAHQILPRDVNVKIYLAYSYHLLHNYERALIYYRDITWSEEAPMLERSQAYCYLANKLYSKAWKVFLDLKKKGLMAPEDVPLLMYSFLQDAEANGNKAFQGIDFPEEEKAPVLFSAFYIHDGLYDRALSLLGKIKQTKAQELQRLWFMGKSASLKGDKKLAVAYWQELLDKCLQRQTHTETKINQLLEVGLAFLEAGYAQEAMKTWEKLREISTDYAHLNKLYAYTIDLNAYLLAQRGNIKIAISEWEKAFNYDSSNTSILQNLAIAYMLVDNFETSALYWNKVIARWRVMVDRNPHLYAHLSVAIGEVERLLSDVFVATKQLEEDVYTVKTEEMVDYYQRANQFYWILGLDKNATRGQIEKSYFRLIKIFDPERHPADFMLLEEAYANLTDEKKRERINIFVFNTIDIHRLKEIVFGTELRTPTFEDLGLTIHVPKPDFSQLKPDTTKTGTIVEKLTNELSIYFRLGDQAMV